MDEVEKVSGQLQTCDIVGLYGLKKAIETAIAAALLVPRHDRPVSTSNGCIASIPVMLIALVYKPPIVKGVEYTRLFALSFIGHGAA